MLFRSVGGGVYSGGGEFNIQERDANPLPIVLIVDADVERTSTGQQAVIHYHEVDKGKYSGTTDYKHGIAWAEHGSTLDDVEFNSSTNPNHTDGEAGCHRITLTVASGKTYDVKAWASYNVAGTAYRGETVITTFNTFSSSTPTVLTGSASNITSVAANANGKIIDTGGYAITGRGILYTTTASLPVIGTSGVTQVSETPLGTGDFFTVGLTNLTPNTKYYIRAYAINSNGTAYGDTTSFVTLASLPTVTLGDITGIAATGASFSGSATFSGGTITEYGFVGSTDDDPALENGNATISNTNGGVTVDEGSFSGAISTLNPSTLYYVRAYAKCADGIGYSDIRSFTTPSSDGAPVVRSTRLSNITQTSLDATGTVVYKGNSDVTAAGFKWVSDTEYDALADPSDFSAWSHDALYGSTPITADNTAFTVGISGLEAGTNYYLVAYATNTAGTAYGNVFSIITLPKDRPNVIIENIVNDFVTSPTYSNTATIYCKVDNGGAAITACGVKYSTTSGSSYTEIAGGETEINNANDSGEFSITIPSSGNLEKKTTYYVVAYATNSEDTHTCQEASFRTGYIEPTVTFATFPIIANNAATAQLSFTPKDDRNVKTYGVCWSTVANPTRSRSEVLRTDYAEATDATGWNSVQTQNVFMGVSPATALLPNTKYYVRTFVSVEEPDGSGKLADIVYGPQSTVVTLPEVVTPDLPDGSLAYLGATLPGRINHEDVHGNLVGGEYGILVGFLGDTDLNLDNYRYKLNDIVTEAHQQVFNYSFTFNFDTDDNTYYEKASGYRRYKYRAYYKKGAFTVYGDVSSDFKPYNGRLELVVRPTTDMGTATLGQHFYYVDVFNYEMTQPISMEATPNTGYAFADWAYKASDYPGTSANITISNAINPSTTLEIKGGSSYLLPNEIVVYAHFTGTDEHTLTLQADGTDGTITVGGTSYALTDGTPNNVPSDISSGSTLAISASTTASGYGFSHWEVSNTNNLDTPKAYIVDPYKATTTLYMGTEDATLKACYVPTHTLTINTQSTNGTYTGSPTVKDAAGNTITSGAQVAEGTKLSISISDYKFAYWTCSGTGASIENPDLRQTTFTMGTANATLTLKGSASYYYYQFGTSTPQNGKVKGTTHIGYEIDNKNSTYRYSNHGVGGHSYITVQPNPGYSLASWTLTGTGSTISGPQADGRYVFTMGTANATLTPNFSANSYNLSATANDDDAWSVSATVGGSSVTLPASSVAYGSAVVLTITINNGYLLESYTMEGMSKDFTASISGNVLTLGFTMGAGNATLAATFITAAKGDGVSAGTGGTGAGVSTGSGASGTRPRDIYPAPAREPWDWDDEFFPTDTLRNGEKDNVQPVNIPQIDNNSAAYGGGVYVEYNQNDPAKIVFAGGSTSSNVGTINNNKATEAGGGVYISQGASMQMKGHCQVNSNHVPSGKKGGGIYLDGTLLVGNEATDGLNVHSLQVNLNWVGADNAYTEATRNNVYLPLDPILTGDALHKMRVITLLSDISGKTGTEYNSKIGLSVDRGYREVIYSEKDEHDGQSVSTKQWLEHLMPETGSSTLNSAIFEDSQQYYALHVSPSDDLFDEDYIYLWSCWTSIVTINPNSEESPFFVENNTHYEKVGDVWHIKTNYGLAWFSSIVNGLNGQSAQPSAKAVIENDLDMNAYFWVPLGSVSGSSGTGTEIAFTDGGSYTGDFNGQGHVISGLNCTYMTGVKKYGLFGTVADNGKVWNTFVDDYRFSTYKQKDGENWYETDYKLGGIAAETTGSAVISNCEARGTMKTPYCSAASTYVGGLVGLMNGTNEVHSSMAMPEISGKAQKVGGLVGQIDEDNILRNSFANPKLGVIDNTVNVGGLVGNNKGTVENCYARLQNDYTGTNAPTNFYWFAGSNTGSITYCYAPARTDCASVLYVPSGTTANPTGHGNYTATQRISGKYGFKHRDHQLTEASSSKDETPSTYISSANNNTLVGGLTASLNAWVDANTGYSTWTRTMASPINDDYPILEFNDFVCVGSEDSIYMLYNADINPMLTSFNAVEESDHPTPSIFLYKANPNPINTSNNDNVMLAINEDVGILQSVPLKARVGVTIKNARKGDADFTDDPNWHLFSSAIREVPMGLEYHTADEQNNDYVTNIVNGGPHPDNVWGDRDQFDPPQTTWSASSIGYFPTDTPYGTWRPGISGGHTASAEDGFFDLYDYSEVYYHWINYKREGTDAIQDHWHYDKDAGDGKHYKITDYRNDVTMPAGKGYMMALSSESMMMTDGTLNNGGISKAVTYTPVGSHLPPNGHGSYAYDEPYRTLNLVGNPYQSYLDFYELVFNATDGENNQRVLYDNNGYYSFAVRNDDNKENPYVYYTITQSENPEVTASRYIHPHQGFFVKAKDNGDLKFNNDMRTTDGHDATFRYEQVNYPLVNLLCYDGNGHRDVTTVEVKRPDQGGGLKMTNLFTSNGQVSASMDGNVYQTLFVPEGVDMVPVHFKAFEEGFFTLRWNTLHGDFSYLHLIDNLTGADIDCLTNDEYKFEGKTTDYKSRFKLVFDCMGIDEPDDPDPAEGSTVFAFQMGDELIVNGEGSLQLFDLNGRCLLSTQVVGAQSSVSLPQVAAGLYLLQLTGDKQSRVQKMVIK